MLKKDKIIANILIIGVGAHARRIYIPRIIIISKHMHVKLALGVDIEENKEYIEAQLKSKKISLKMKYLKQFNYKGGLPKDAVEQLNLIVKENNIQGVIISTGPLLHKVYAEWALSQGLNILMDKPISTHVGASTSMRDAKNIYADYRDLLQAYLTLQKKKKTIFSINVQRRYEVGYQKVFELINEVKLRFNTPVTSIQAMHSDGVWIFPDEVVEQVYHPYSEGYGKCSHSGYHIFDIVWRFYKAGLIEEKKPDHAEIFTSFLTPTGLLNHIDQNDYSEYFPDYKLRARRTTHELKKLYNGYGEIDAFTVLRLLKKDVNICNISINLLHNSFSRRSWLTPDSDLYKGNGRVKHQSYTIQQGPFQCIQIHNYQENDVQDKNTLEDYSLGGNNHFDIYVFRNAAMFGKSEVPLKVYNLKNLDEENTFDDSRLYHESVKDTVILEFINFILGNIDEDELKSNITSHEMPVQIMSSVYVSNVKQITGQNPIVNFKINSI